MLVSSGATMSSSSMTYRWGGWKIYPVIRATRGSGFYDLDVADFLSIRRYFKGIDWVFHLAARADIVPSVQHPMLYHQANVDGTVSVLEAARECGVKRFIYAASSSCYGIPANSPPRKRRLSPRSIHTH